MTRPLPTSAPPRHLAPLATVAALLLLAVAPRAAGACDAGPQVPRSVRGLQLLGALAWPTDPASVPGFGGISGIDHDPVTGRWWALSDDRSEHAPARVYELDLSLGAAGPGRPVLRAVHALRRGDGQLYAGPAAPAAAASAAARQASAGAQPSSDEPADGEALRRDPCDGTLWWASEGAPERGHAAAARRIARDGRHLGTLALPPALGAPPRPGEPQGPRPNRSFEGLAFTADGGALWLALEAPLLQDGPPPSRDHGALVRFTRFERHSAGAPFTPAGQLAYAVDAMPREGSGGRRRADHGVSEILAAGDGTLLVVERGGHEVAADAFDFVVRLYLADPVGADDVAAWPTLAGRTPRPMRKRLLLDLAQAGTIVGAGTGTGGGLPVGNIEAAAWGPRLADGRATLLLVSDDNFSPRQPTQWLLFAVLE